MSDVLYQRVLVTTLFDSSLLNNAVPFTFMGYCIVPIHVHIIFLGLATPRQGAGFRQRCMQALCRLIGLTSLSVIILCGS